MGKHNKDILSKTLLFVATPCYGGMVTEKYTQSLINFTSIAMQNNLRFGYFTRSNESLITRARNDLAFSFLQSPATHLMFIDADINFNPADILKLLYHDKDIVTGAYPTKIIDWENMSKAKTNGIEELQQKAIKYASGFSNKKDQDGLMEVSYGATGFMLIKREVIMKMIKHYPEIQYMPEVYDNKNEEGLPKHALFDTMIYNGKYLSEDYTFCHRWQQMGGKIYLDPSIVLDHVGTYTFKGSTIN
jgi:hypothetical protein